MPTRPERDAVRRYLRDWREMPPDFPAKAILDAYDQIDELEAMTRTCERDGDVVRFVDETL